MRKFILPIMASLVLLVQSCRKDEETFQTISTSNYNSSIARTWFDFQLKLIKETPGYSPPVAARSLGYAGVTLYEAVVPGMEGYKSLRNKISGFDSDTFPRVVIGIEYNWSIVANAALATFQKKQFATTSSVNLIRVDSIEAVNFNALVAKYPKSDASASVEFGKRVGKAVYDYAATDGQSNASLTNFPAYVLPVGPQYWLPTGPAKTPLQPYWGSVRPFLIASVANCQPQGHPIYSEEVSSAFYIDSKEVYDAVTNITGPQREIAEFWSDDPGKTATPPGHAISIATQVLETLNSNLATAAITYVKMGIAVHDAFVSCWKTKYDYPLLRPVTYIQRVIDPSFTTIISTPPFPEYTSGHSVLCGASMSIMTNLFGNNFAFSDFTHFGRTDINGNPRNYPSFNAAGEEGAISRLYGGIHYRFGIADGVKQGREIGQEVIKLDLKK